MNDFITWVMSSEETKPFITTFLGAGAAVTVFSLAWQTVRYLVAKIKHTFIVSMVISPDNYRKTYSGGWVHTSIDRVGEWLMDYRGLKYSKSFQFSGYDNETGNQYSLGYGLHYVIWKKRIFIINMYRLNSNSTDGKNIEVKISTIGLSKQRLKDFFNHIVDFYQEDTLKVGTIDNHGNMGYTNLKERDMDTVILQDDLKNAILRTINEFEKEENKEWYSKRNINRVLGMLFYGSPGTGKTSIIRAIATEFKNNIHVIPLSNMSDQVFMSTLKSEISHDPNTKTRIWVFEDIDCISSTHNRDISGTSKEKPTSSISLSTILNVIDGVDGIDNAIIIATTNHIEKLDPALIRPGRFGHHFKFDLFGYDEIQKYAMYAYGYHLPNLPKTEKRIAPCELQQLLLANLKDMNGFESGVIELLNKEG